MSSGHGIALFAVNAPFSQACLAQLVNRGLPPVHIILPGLAPLEEPTRKVQRRPLWINSAAKSSAAMEMLATQHHIPVSYTQFRSSRDTEEILQLVQSDLIVVACFPYRLPAEFLQLSPLAVNLHPSLLPSYRGPAPLFWQLRHFEPHLGLTLHLVNASFDGGAILAQKAIPRPTGQSAFQLHTLLANLAIEMLIQQVLTTLQQDGPIGGVVQDESRASYFPLPKDSDFSISPSATAVDNFDFMRGTCDWGKAYRLHIEGGAEKGELFLGQALACWPDRQMTEVIQYHPEYVLIQCKKGVLKTTYAVGHAAPP